MNDLSISNYDIVKKIGDGQYAKVYLAVEKLFNKTVALKCLSKKIIDKKISEDLIKREIKIQYSLNHDNILKLFGYFSDHKQSYLVLEYCKNGEMYKDIIKCRGYNNQRAATYIYQIASALNYCHNREIIHRDIKSENILLTGTGSVKIADFGCSKKIKKENRQTFCGTLSYLTPEMLSGGTQTDKIDIWCLGVLLYEMLTTKNPFHDPDGIKTRENIREIIYTVPENIHILAEFFFYSVFRKDSTERLSAKQLLTFPYVERFAEKTLIECKAALLQWEEIHNMPPEEYETSSINVKCPTFDFNTASPNNVINIHEAGTGGSQSSFDSSKSFPN